ncbi:MAG: M23 family metallopeptidase [Bdellovibrionaceae bacterium]|nr:M23 family metallopeptidase [Pseudobdellovibrionaceae bacterium]
MAKKSFFSDKSLWLRDRFLTLMVIPERTRKVHKLVIPFFAIKLSVTLFSLAVISLMFVGIDYVRVLGQIAENKRLKGENFKLRQEVQLIRNKVDNMEFTIERVRNYAKKLQVLTGQTEKSSGGSKATRKRQEKQEEPEREPAGESGDLESSLQLPKEEPKAESIKSLESRVGGMEIMTITVQSQLANLEDYLFSRRAIAKATPSIVPIPGYVSSTFGYRYHPLDGRRRLHHGVDIVAEPGTPVRAPAPGLVVFSGYKSGYGKVVVIDHGFGIRTLFAHNSKLFVNRGVNVKRGDVISQVGSTGHSTGPHLHYEIRKNGSPINPAPFLQESPF